MKSDTQNYTLHCAVRIRVSTKAAADQRKCWRTQASDRYKRVSDRNVYTQNSEIVLIVLDTNHDSITGRDNEHQIQHGPLQCSKQQLLICCKAQARCAERIIGGSQDFQHSSTVHSVDQATRVKRDWCNSPGRWKPDRRQRSD